MTVSGHLIARNSLLNFAGQGLPLLVGLLAVPSIVSHLSAERFGLLSLVWALLGTFALFNFGLSRATTKYVAECLAEGKERDGFSALVWTSFWLQMAIASLLVIPAALSLRSLMPLLRISAALAGEARDVFLILIFSIPIIVAVLAWRGVLEGAGRFDLVNLVRGPQVAMIFLLPAVVLPFGFGLRTITLLMVLAWLASGLLYAAQCLRAFPSLRRMAFAPSIVRRLAVYGGWVSVTNLIAPAFVYSDRFLIGSLVSMTAVGFYAVPFEMTTRLTIIPSSIASTLFPAFSALSSSGKDRSIVHLFYKSLQYLALISGPLVLILVCSAHLLLRLWLGADFAARSTTVLQLLAVSILFNSVAYIPVSFLQSIGRPDLPAKFNMAELPVYLGAAFLLTKHSGINGAALATLLRVVADTLLLFIAAYRTLQHARFEQPSPLAPSLLSIVAPE